MDVVRQWTIVPASATSSRRAYTPVALCSHMHVCNARMNSTWQATTLRDLARFSLRSLGSRIISRTQASSGVSSPMRSPIQVGTLQCEFNYLSRRIGCECWPRVNTFLELKMENERLQQRVAHLRAQAKALNVMYPASSPTNSSNSSSAQFTQHMSQAGGDAYFTAYEETPGISSQGQDKYNDADDDGSDPNGSRKKVNTYLRLPVICWCSSHTIQAKRVVNGPEQHVCQTCGRTDSPEWRKVSLRYTSAV